MSLHNSIIRAAVLLMPLYCAQPILKPDDPPIKVQRSPAVQISVPSESRHHRCFEQPNGAKEAIHRLPAIARYWLGEDAVYIITPGERCAFLRLETDEEREQFVEQFWLRRTFDRVWLDYDFKAEHYRRIVFANENYGGSLSGWKTDRGRIYVLFGPPDSVDQGPAGMTPSQSSEMHLRPTERWNYKYIKGIGENVQLVFEYLGGYRGYSLSVDSFDLLARGDPNPERFPITAENRELYGVASPAPKVRFKDLEAIAVSQIVRDQVKFGHRIAFAAATQATTLARIEIEIPYKTQTRNDQEGQDVPTPAYQLFVRISKPSGWVVQTSELTVGGDANAKFDSRLSQSAHLDAPLTPGWYQLAIVAKNAVTSEVGVIRTQLNVPTYDPLETKN
jgi:GWxTD domain-containing protein